MQFPFQTCSVTLTVVVVHSLWNEKFAANNLQTWAAHRAQNKPCIITLIWLAVCINSTCAHASVRNWRRKLCRMQLKMWSWHTTCKVVFWAEHKHTQRSLAVTPFSRPTRDPGWEFSLGGDFFPPFKLWQKGGGDFSPPSKFHRRVGEISSPPCRYPPHSPFQILIFWKC